MPFMTDVQRNFLIGIGIVAVLGFGIYALSRPAAAPSGAAGGLATTTTDGVSGTGGYTVNETTTTLVHAPDYRTAIKFAASVSLEVRAALNVQLAEVQQKLDKNKTDLTAWITLGGIYKTGGDYADAAAAWEYVSAVSSTDTITPNNLGDLYMNFLKDYPKAEANYKKSILLSPKNVSTYVNLYYLYHDLYRQGTGADEAILEEGLKANPGDQSLLGLKAQTQ